MLNKYFDSFSVFACIAHHGLHLTVVSFMACATVCLCVLPCATVCATVCY